MNPSDPQCPTSTSSTSTVARWLAIAIATAATLSGQEINHEVAPPPDTVQRATFDFDNLQPQAAQLLVLEFCAKETTEPCQVLQYTGDRAGGRIVVAGSAGVLASLGRRIADRDRIDSTPRIQVSVVEATTLGEQRLAGLTDGARQALQDAASLLPFRGLALLDVALVETGSRASTRVSGPGGLDYEVDLTIEPMITLDGPTVVVDRFVIARAAYRTETGAVEGHQRVLQTSFEVTPGETVVVGTSRLNGGDSALIVLVSAVAGENGG